MTFIILVTAFVLVPTLPSESAHPILLVELVRAFVGVAVLSIVSFPPLSSPVLQAVLELAQIHTLVFPFVLAVAFGLPKLVGACEDVSVCKDVTTLPVLQTVLPLPFVPITILPLMHSISISFRVAPLTNVGVAKYTFPDSLTFF